jgi:hypothetical protein
MKGQETMNLSNWYEAEGLGGNQLLKARQSVQNWLHLFTFPAWQVTNIVEATYQFLVQRFHISDCFLAAFFFQMSATTKKNFDYELHVITPPLTSLAPVGGCK